MLSILDTDSPHSPAASEMAAALAEACGSSLDRIAAPREATAGDNASQTVSEPTARIPIGGSPADSLQWAVRDTSGVVVVAAEVDTFWGRATVGSLTEEVIRRSHSAVCVIKGMENRASFTFRRLWQRLFSAIPTLSREELFGLYASMRHDARAGADFYILILVASLIATFGLLQNSPAVIIGAMLVAPLMSPILALAHGIVIGNNRMIRRSWLSIMRGIVGAVGISAVAVILAGNFKPGSEILNRTQPNLLDLVVAIASGAAAAYAISRKSVSAALPGVAISAALVPPLCVVGFGIGISNFQYAGGALLLFMTNLTAIVLMGAVVFLLLGVKPRREARGKLTRAYLSVALLATLMVCIPLGLASFSMTTKSRIEDRIEATIARIPEHILHIEDVRVFRDKDCYVAEMTVYLHNQVDAEEVRDLPAYIARQTNARVRLRATMVKADFQEIGMDPGVEEPSGAGDERLPEGLDSGEASPIGGEDQGAKTTPGRLHKAKTLQM